MSTEIKWRQYVWKKSIAGLLWINNVNNYVLIISDIFIHNRQFYIHIYAFDTLRQTYDHC